MENVIQYTLQTFLEICAKTGIVLINKTLNLSLPLATSEGSVNEHAT